MKSKIIKKNILFNNAIEVGLRCLILLEELKVSKDLQTLVYFDYILLHFNDFDKKTESISDNTPYRSGEILVKRDAIKQGLLLMYKKQLVDIVMNEKGIEYVASSIAPKFLGYFKSEYCERLRETAKIIAKKYSILNQEELKKLFAKK